MSRLTYNETLLDSVDYSNTGKLKRILNTWWTLTDLSVKGDQVALSIMVDLKACFGEYPLSPTLLSKEEVYLVKANLIYG